jgi:hypothetical protein
MINSISFTKGSVAEQEVVAYLEKRGYRVYRAVTPGCHPFDFLAISPSNRVYIVECKAKASRNYYPDTGIDEKHYNTYKALSDALGVDVILIFVDEKQGSVYGNRLSVLDTPRWIEHEGRVIRYPLTEQYTNGVRIRYFPICAMLHLFNLAPTTQRRLITLSNRSYDYHSEGKK